MEGLRGTQAKMTASEAQGEALSTPVGRSEPRKETGGLLQVGQLLQRHSGLEGLHGVGVGL